MDITCLCRLIDDSCILCEEHVNESNRISGGIYRNGLSESKKAEVEGLMGKMAGFIKGALGGGGLERSEYRTVSAARR